MKNKAIITFTDSLILPVEVQFPKSIGHYRTLDDALTDIRRFGCIAIFHQG